MLNKKNELYKKIERLIKVVDSGISIIPSSTSLVKIVLVITGKLIRKWEENPEEKEKNLKIFSDDGLEVVGYLLEVEQSECKEFPDGITFAFTEEELTQHLRRQYTNAKINKMFKDAGNFALPEIINEAVLINEYTK